MSNFFAVQVIVVVIVRSHRTGFSSFTFVRSIVYFSSSVIVVSPFLSFGFGASIDFTVITIDLGCLGTSPLIASSGRRSTPVLGSRAPTARYVHSFPTASGRILDPQADGALPTGNVLASLSFASFAAGALPFGAAAAGANMRASKIEDLRSRAIGSLVHTAA